MNKVLLRYLLLIIVVCVGSGCANIVPPTGGKKDTTPPKIVAVKPGDSLLNTKVSKVELRFDEYVELKDLKEVQISPLLPFPPTMVVVGKKAVLSFEDSVLRNNTTYRISFGKSIADLRESNPLKPYTYVFSTGSYFDSLRLDGVVLDAATGMPDSGVNILLYEAGESDSVVVRKKPLYIGRANGGRFTVAGLPNVPFRIYALKDANDNMTYDGKGERIGFIDSIVRPVDSIGAPLVFKVFEENIIDTVADETEETTGKKTRKKLRQTAKDGFNYVVNADTTNLGKRSLDVTKPLTINFSSDIDSINRERMSLMYDSVVTDSIVIEIEVPFTADTDTVQANVMLINSDWKENTVYTLRLQKGFAKDSAGNEVTPSKHRFRTRNDDDYSKLTINLPSKYTDSTTGYLLLVKGDKDTVYLKPVKDTVVKLVKLEPGGYNMFLIEDKNGNGKWDTGDLFEKRQPENVIPFTQKMQLKAAWENTFDFVEEVKKPDFKKGTSPKKRDTGLRK